MTLDEHARELERLAAAGDPAARAALERTRARLGVATCDFRHAERDRRLCVHLVAATKADYTRRFTGVGVASELLCEACAEPGATPELAEACVSCFERAERANDEVSFTGTPGVLERPSDLRFERRTLDLAAVGTAPILALAAAPAAPRWVAFLADGTVRVLDAASGAVLSAVHVNDEGVARERPVALHVSARGDLAAIANERGRHGVVVDTATGRATLRLDRQDYHEDVSDYSLAFVERGGRSLLVHATDWNRLDVSDARTGELLTARTFEPRAGETRRPLHDLDYFHCGLLASPDGRWLADNGWVWHPVGVVRSWSLDRWLVEDPYESEDGPSAKDLCQRAYFWDGPLAWVGPKELAVYGYGDDDERLLDAALVFDVESGRRVRWFAGPEGSFFALGGWLVACHRERGATVWDPATGERLLVDAALRATHAHPATGELALLEGRALHLARLAGRAPRPENG